MSLKEFVSHPAFQEFKNQFGKEFLNSFPPEERIAGIGPKEALAGFTPSQRVEGLSISQRVEGLSIDDLEKLLEEKRKNSNP